MRFKRVLIEKIRIIVNKNLEKKLRKKLKNQNFSIFSPNCIAGNIYHRLGQKFLSPTINCWMNQSDYLKFVTNLDHYLASSLNEVKDSNKNFPVGSLDDIVINFNHYESFQEAKFKWDERKTRINKDNMFFIFYNFGEYSSKDMQILSQRFGNNKIIFLTPLKTLKNNKLVVYMKPRNRENGQYYLDKNFLKIRTFEKMWDFVSWLNV